MKKINYTLLKATKNIISLSVNKEQQNWPPICTTLLHQPKRPKCTNKN